MVQQLTYQAEKKRAIVQQTIWITDSVAIYMMHQCAHYRPIRYRPIRGVVGQGVNKQLTLHPK